MVWIPRWNSPKRKEDNENAVRRALLAGGFAAGASGLLTRKALADTPYTSFAYPLSSLPSMRRATATRTSLQRFADVFNVKDFGALGNNSHDGTAAIQAAINAAIDNGGGTVYFPAGRYIVSRRLVVVPREIGNPNLTFLGAGGAFDGQGSSIEGKIHDYLLYVSQIGKTLRSIQGLCFKNGAQFTFNSAEPAGNPDGHAYPPGTVTDGGGCVYLGSGVGSTIINCDFACASGICLHYGAYQLTVMGCNFTGGGFSEGQTNLNSSIGISTRGFIELHACKMYAFGTAITAYGTSLAVSGINLEISGVGIRLGNNPIGYWDHNFAQYFPPWSSYAASGRITDCGMESCGHAFIEINGASNLAIDNVSMGSYAQIGTPEAGIRIGWGSDIRVSNCGIAGAFSSAAVDVSSTPGAQIRNIVFEGVSAQAVSGGGVDWKFPPAANYRGQFCNPCAYINCNTDGAVPLAQLPATAPDRPPFISSHPVVITDSVAPLWDPVANKSNVGKPAVGGGTNKVLVRWNPQLAKWVLAG